MGFDHLIFVLFMGRRSPGVVGLGRVGAAGRLDGGFSFVQLVVVMFVIGVLVSVASASYLGLRNNSFDRDAQNSVGLVLSAAQSFYGSQGDFSDGSSAQCGDSSGLAADLQRLQPNVDVVASSVSSTNSRVVSVQAVQTYSSNGELLGCQGFYAVAFSSTGSCWAARFISEGKFLVSGRASPVVVNTQTNTSNSAVVTWSALAVNGQAFGVLKPQSSAADGDNTNSMASIQTACKARTQSTGAAALSTNYIAPSQFYASWRDTVAAPVVIPPPTCAQGGTCVLGDLGPGGGRVFYVSATNFTSTGSDCNTTCKYLEAAPSNVVGKRWAGDSDNTRSTGSTRTAIGGGYANTLNTSSDTANALAFNFENNGKTDWHLPSKDELNEMCKWQFGLTQPAGERCQGGVTVNSGVGASGFDQCCYWSSTEASETTAWEQQFTSGATMAGNSGNGYIGVPSKTTQLAARFARAFGPTS